MPADEEPRVALGDLDDEGLLAALREVIGEPVPAWSADLAKASYGLREADAALAALVSDSGLDAASATVRSGAPSRLAVFEAADLSVEIEIELAARAGSWRLTGQLTPAAPARIQVRRQQSEPAWVDADDRGRFAVGHLQAVPLSLLCLRPGLPATATEWIVVG
jgi:hypothetical protein